MPRCPEAGELRGTTLNRVLALFPSEAGRARGCGCELPGSSQPTNTQFSSLLERSPAVTSGARGEAAAYGGPAVPPVTRSQGTLKLATKAWCRI